MMNEIIKNTTFKNINFRYLSIWLVCWGNIAGLFDFMFLQLNLYNLESSIHLRIYYYSAIIALLICYWLIPKINSRLSSLNKFKLK